MNRKTYTLSELAALLGVSYSAVCSAKNNRNLHNVMPDSSRAKVLIGMANLGITWDQVVKVPLGKSTNGAVPVSELLANSKETPTGESIGNPFESLPQLPPSPESASTGKPEQKKHCYIISLRGRNSAGSYVWRSIAGGFEEKKVTKRDITEAIERAGLRFDAIPVAISYLGAMTKEEFENV